MELKDILEAILFSSLKPLSAKELQDILRQAGESGEGDTREFTQAKAKAAIDFSPPDSRLSLLLLDFPFG